METLPAESFEIRCVARTSLASTISAKLSGYVGRSLKNCARSEDFSGMILFCICCCSAYQRRDALLAASCVHTKDFVKKNKNLQLKGLRTNE